MKKLHTLTMALLALVFAAGAVPALAQWELDNERSSISFLSVKNSSIAEAHTFSSVVGFIGTDGKVQVGIDLDSVQTLIDIRDERMRQLLFETAKFPAANITAQIDEGVLSAVIEGGTVTGDVPVTLSLHGFEKELKAPVAVIGEPDGPIRVLSTRPIVINAADFALEGGVAALQEIAGLAAISRAVPVSLHLVFTAVE